MSAQGGFAGPPQDCDLCPRLLAFRKANQTAHPAFFNAPVPSFGPLAAAVLVVGLAPGLRGANRTARPFTGDGAGDVLYPALLRVGWAKGTYGAAPDDGLIMTGARISNAVRCVPPQNKVTGAEINTCNDFLRAEMAAMLQLRAVLALGTVAHGAVLKALGRKASAATFGHGALHNVDGLLLADSYHCSRYNMNTGRLTKPMLDAVMQAVDAAVRT